MLVYVKCLNITNCKNLGQLLQCSPCFLLRGKDDKCFLNSCPGQGPSAGSVQAESAASCRLPPQGKMEGRIIQARADLPPYEAALQEGVGRRVVSHRKI